ncbi:MAG: glycosyltransferase [Chthoniobacterales bacterium]|nr:glycosyltransferase [Chthoniobacterales bacterium]
MNVALAHHWLVGMRGGEKVLEQFGQLFPDAPIYTLLAAPRQLSPALQRHSIHQSLLARLPAAARYYPRMLPLFPAALRGLRLPRATQFLLTSDASLTKGLSYDPSLPHVCYCHSPPRYLWGMEETYLKHTAGLSRFGKSLFRQVIPRLRRFDHEAAQKVTHFIANSRYVQKRIRQTYGRESTVIHPPVAIGDYSAHRPAEDFYLVVAQLVPYKRIDLAVKVFNSLGKRLVVIGGGAELGALRARAKSNITFLGRQPFPVVKDYLERCRAFVFPGVEDFGITLVEAQAAGRPVISFAGGGALETVVDGRTGVFFHEQTVEALREAVLAFEEKSFRPEFCRAQAECYGPARFRAELKAFLAQALPQLFSRYGWPC